MMIRSLMIASAFGVLMAFSTVPAALADDHEGVACTMDAKICPDGSYVGRTAPDCEFAPCPGEEGDDAEDDDDAADDDDNGDDNGGDDEE